MFSNIAFADPFFFVLLLLLPLVGWWYWQRHKQHYAPITMSSLAAFGERSSWRGRARALLPILRGIAFALLVVALARPQKLLENADLQAEGIDIMLSVDVSPSMLSQDFTPDRLQVAKKVAADFVRRRETDRIGLVVFAGEAYSPCPLTVDRGVLLEILDNLKVGVLQDGTAIGMGLSTAVNRIQSSSAKSKIIILMTDGVNNRGYFSPEQAMTLAQGLGIKVYTIGVGSRGEALSPVGIRDGQYIFAMQPVEIDENLLLKIAKTTGGNYYRATSADELEKIYAEIDQLEKSKIDYTAYRRRTEAFGIWVFAAVCCVILELLLRYTIFRTIP